MSVMMSPRLLLGEVFQADPTKQTPLKRPRKMLERLCFSAGLEVSPQKGGRDGWRDDKC